MRLLFWKWKPEKNVWYKFYDTALPKKEFIYKDKWDEPKPLIAETFYSEDRLKVKPYAIIKGKKYWARFYITDKDCLISIKHKKQIKVSLKKCSFNKRIKEYYQGQSKVHAYSLTVIVKE